MSVFLFREFSVRNDSSALKVGTDAVLLGAAMSISSTCRRMLDIGTGTGVIALLCAQRAPEAEVDAIEIDRASEEEAERNFAESPWPGRLHASLQDLRTFEPGTVYDHIFSNPPFYDNSLENPDPRAAAARHTGTLSPAQIFAFAESHLSAEGRLSLILPAEGERAVLRLAASFGLFPFRILRVKTTERKPFRRVVMEFSRRKVVPGEDSLCIMDGQEYSPAYRALTDAYYYREN